MAEIKQKEESAGNVISIEIPEPLFTRKPSGNGTICKGWSMPGGTVRFNEFMTNTIQFKKGKALVESYNKASKMACETRKWLGPVLGVAKSSDG